MNMETIREFGNLAVCRRVGNYRPLKKYFVHNTETNRTLEDFSTYPSAVMWAQDNHTKPDLTPGALNAGWAQVEIDFGRKFSDDEWETVAGLESIARDLSELCASEINRRAVCLPIEPIRYNAQWTLERLISFLQSKV